MKRPVTAITIVVLAGVASFALHGLRRIEYDAISPSNSGQIKVAMLFDEVIALLREEPHVIHWRDKPFEIAIAKTDHFRDREAFWFPHCMVIDETLEEKVCADAYWEGARGYIRVGFDDRNRVLRVEFHPRQATTTFGKIQEVVSGWTWWLLWD
jgi:hypothetical protein